MAQKRKHHTKKLKRHTTVGRIFPPIDVRNTNLIKEAIKRIIAGPITIIVFYADWCGHCTQFKPHFDAAARMPGRSIQAVKVNEKMVGHMNDAIRSMNSSASPLPVDAYPSAFLLDNKGNNITEINAVKDTKAMSKVMKEAGQNVDTVALNSPKPPSGSHAPRSLSILNNEKPKGMPLGLKNRGSTNSLPPVVSTREEFNGSAEEVAASFGEPSAEDVTVNLVEPPGSKGVEDMLAEKGRSVPGTAGGGSRGGSLYSALASSTYKLAPAAVLLGLAAAATTMRRRRGKARRKTSRRN